MTREERQQKIESAFPYEPITSDKEDITRCLDNERQIPWVQICVSVLLVAALAAYLYKNYFQ